MTNGRPEKEAKNLMHNIYLPIGIVITIISMAIAGGIAWGQLHQQNEDQDRRIVELEKRREILEEVRADQRAIKADVQGLRREQKLQIEGLDQKIDLLLQRQNP